MKKCVWIPLLILGILLVLVLVLVLASPHLLLHYMFTAPSRSTKVPDYYIGPPTIRFPRPA